MSKFSKASIFSGLNMLRDISLLKKYGNICGYTQKELEENFKDYLEDVNFDEVREWYGGYWFLKDKIYNPFNILQYLKNKEFDNYWLTSGNPSFLIKLIEEKKYFLPNLSDLVNKEIVVDKKILDVPKERVDTEVLLYQTGYLTIKEVEKAPSGTMEYRLNFPNKEVKMAFNDAIIKYLTGQKPQKEKKNLYASMAAGDIEGFINTFKRIFASIPSNDWTHTKSYESTYANIMHGYLQALEDTYDDIKIIREVPTNKGRIDLTASIGDKIYIMEFKVIRSEKEKGTALKQIKEKKYYEKYINKGEEVYLVGIECSEKERNIVNFEYIELDRLLKLKEYNRLLSDKPLSDKSLSDELGNLEGPKKPKL